MAFADGHLRTPPVALLLVQMLVPLRAHAASGAKHGREGRGILAEESFKCTLTGPGCTGAAGEVKGEDCLFTSYPVSKRTECTNSEDNTNKMFASRFQPSREWDQELHIWVCRCYAGLGPIAALAKEGGPALDYIFQMKEK